MKSLHHLNVAKDEPGTFSIQPLTGALGAEVAGVDLAGELDNATFALVERAWLDHLVLFFRNQDLTPEQHLAISRRFGSLVQVPYIKPLAAHPEIIAVRKATEERNISVFGGAWHADFTSLREPPSASLLYAREVPTHGGDTVWANAELAYARLSSGLRDLLDGLTAMHSGHVYGAARPPTQLRTSTSIEISRGNPEADREVPHPVVRVHPVTGRRALFVNPIYTTRFADMTEEESAPLLGFLYAHATQPAFCCRWRWRVGDLAIWDNRATLHLAINDYDGQNRLMHRTTVAGDAPRGVRMS